MQSPTKPNLTDSNTQIRDSKFFYGWIVLAACMVIIIITSGIRFSFGVFLTPLSIDFGLSRVVTSEIFSVYMILSSVSMLLGGWASDRYKTRNIFIMMGLFSAFALFLTSQAREPWHIFISYGLLFALGSGPMYIQSIGLALKWFEKRRGLAVGIVSSAAGIGTMLMTPLSAWLIAGYNWQISYFILGLVVLFTIIPCAFLLKEPLGHIGVQKDSREIISTKSSALKGQQYTNSRDISLTQAAKTSIFWVLLTIRFLYSCCVFIVITHIVPHAIDIGANPISAASILSLIGVGVLLGRLVMGRMSDSIGSKRTIYICTSLMAGAMLWLIFSSSLWMLYIFATVFGISYGGVAPPLNALIGDTFGMGHIGVIMGVLNSPWNIGAAVGPALAGYIFDVNSSYTIAFIFGMAVSLMTLILALFIRAPIIKQNS
ncbi:MFS transporter [Chloroflexota bacterium]